MAVEEESWSQVECFPVQGWMCFEIISRAVQHLMCGCRLELFNLPVYPKIHHSKEMCLQELETPSSYSVCCLALSSRRCLWFACQSLVGLARSHMQADASWASTEVINNQNKPKSVSVCTSSFFMQKATDEWWHFSSLRVCSSSIGYKQAQAVIGIKYIPCFHVLGMPVGKREYFLFLSLIALLLLWEHELKLQNEDAIEMSRYISEKVLKV